MTRNSDQLKGTLLLKRSELESMMTLADYIDSMENAFRTHGQGNTFGINMIHGDTPGELEFHIKAGGLKLADHYYYGLKMNASNFSNLKKYGLANIMGVILLYDGVHGFPLAIVDAGDPTVKRTGAATAVAAKYLAKKDSKIATICGCGNQGRIQKDHIHAELGAIVAGTVPGRTSVDEIFIYDATGTALQDVASAAACYEKARKNNLGQLINFFS